jgi:CO dehydrogenase/acetyl-CoA synthase beta subunit
VTKELAVDRDEIEKLLQQQQLIFEQRDDEACNVNDEDTLQVICCMKNLSLRGQVG